MTQFPVIEVFGPVIQGEGVLAGVPTHFIRFGGCDFRCSWCDSMYAVEPALVREHAEKLTWQEIIHRVGELEGGPGWVTLSGGNPALLALDVVVDGLHADGYRINVETQGSRWRDWLAATDVLTVSPKPPSSGMADDRRVQQVHRFLDTATGHGCHEERGALKIVVFDEADLEWAAAMFEAWPQWPAFVSVGTDPINEWGGNEVKSLINTRQVRDMVGDRYRWLCEQVSGRPEFAQVRVLPQLHVIAFGHARGV